jgi:hypothetical protein
MVKSLNYEDFVNKLDKFYTESKDKNTVYLTFKRGMQTLIIVYQENFKNKQNRKNRKLRLEDRKNQDKANERFNVLVRAKLKKSRIHTIVIKYNTAQ